MPEVDWVEAFGKAIRSMSWHGDNEMMLKLDGGIKILFYVKDNRLQVEVLSDEGV